MSTDRGILKSPSSASKQPPAEHVQWDEKVIAEHDLDRGTRQKIDEPPTPYLGPQQGGSPETLDVRDPIDVVQDNTQKNATLMNELANALEKHEHDQGFKEKRKAHYNEFLAVKQRQLSGDIDDDDDDIDDDKKL